MKEIYNLCNPRGSCRCPKVYVLSKDEFTTLTNCWSDKIGGSVCSIGAKITILFTERKNKLSNFLLCFSALWFLLKVAVKTDFFDLMKKGTFAHITDEDIPEYCVIYKI